MMLAEYEIEELQDRFDPEECPRLTEATRALARLVDWTNRRSDGWAYWRKPSQASIRLQEKLREKSDEQRRTRHPVEDLTLDEWSRLFRPVRQFLGDQKVEDPDLLLFPPPPPPPPGKGITLTREQLEDWAGRSLTDEQVEQLDESIQFSSIPSAVAEIAMNLSDD